jgi:hypothetical protein
MRSPFEDQKLQQAEIARLKRESERERMPTWKTRYFPQKRSGGKLFKSAEERGTAAGSFTSLCSGFASRFNESGKNLSGTELYSPEGRQAG